MAIDRECGEVCIATTVRDRLAICNKGQARSPCCQMMVMMMRMIFMILIISIFLNVFVTNDTWISLGC